MLTSECIDSSAN